MKVNMIYASDLQNEMKLQYGYPVSRQNIAISLGFGIWTSGAKEVYYGENREWDEDSLEGCIITYLRDVYPEDEYTYIDFDR